MTDMTPIQARIVELRALKLTHPEIGERLGLDVGTVEYQVKTLRRAGVDLPSRGKGTTGPWTPERIEKLRTLYAAGNSASMIAQILTDRDCSLSRNAVIGKLSRLGLVRGDKPRISRPRRAAAPKRSKRVITMPGGKQAEQPRFDAGNFTRWAGKRMNEAAEPPVVALPPAEVWKPLPGIKPVTQASLGLRTCRWPVEAGKKRYGLDRLFCGADAPLGEPYCETHANQAMPAAKRKAA